MPPATARSGSDLATTALAPIATSLPIIILPKTFAPGPTDHDSRIEIVNGNPMDLLPAPTVTKANVDDPKLWANGAKN